MLAALVVLLRSLRLPCGGHRSVVAEKCPQTPTGFDSSHRACQREKLCP